MAAVDWVSTHEDVMPSFTHRQFLPVGPITSLFTRAVGFMCEATHGSPVVVNRKVSESGTDRMCDCIGIFSDAVLLRFIFFAEGYKSDAIGTMASIECLFAEEHCVTEYGHAEAQLFDARGYFLNERPVATLPFWGGQSREL